MIATPVLILACLAGFAAALTGEAFIAVAPLVASVCAMLALAARRWRASVQAPAQVCVSAIALLAAAAAISTGDQGRTAFALFSAAALLGASLAATKPSDRTVEEKVERLDLRVGRQS
jgi:Na+-translocating ferredoxin:NAD+ oxidoreductase RnfD subunit